MEKHDGALNSDLALIERIQRGDGRAFEELYRRHRDWAHNLAYQMTGHREDALDVMQEVFLYLSRKLPQLQLTAQLRTFLYPAVRNLAIAARRKRQRFVSDDAAAAALFAPPDVPVSSELASALAPLSATHREVIVLRFVEDLSLQELADRLAVPVGTVKSRLHHALQLLRQSPSAASYFDLTS
ncbi:MAG: RNA polymerase sigma factor [Planctomycetota bacterium]